MGVVVTIYLYPIGDATTTYHGTLLANFVSSASGVGYERQVDFEIAPGRRATGVATAGLVVSSPGQYVFKMTLFARVATHTDPHEFTETIPVEVVVS